MNLFKKTAISLSKALYRVAGSAIIAMMLLTCIDVVLRYLRRPIPGTYELVCFLGSVAVAFAMAHTSVERGHVSVSILVDLLPQKIQTFIHTVTNGFGFILFALIAWQSVLYANDLRACGEVSLTLQLPFYPFIYGVAFGAAAVCLVLSVELADNLLKAFSR